MSYIPSNPRIPPYSVRELNILSFCFLPTPQDADPILAILHLDHNEHISLIARKLNLEEREFDSQPASELPKVQIRDPDAHLLVPIPRSGYTRGGVLVLGGRRCQYFEVTQSTDTPHRSKKKKRRSDASSPTKDSLSAESTGFRESASASWPFDAVTACVFRSERVSLAYPDNVSSCDLIDPDGSRLLVGDKYGQLALLSLAGSDQSGSLELTVYPLGRVRTFMFFDFRTQ